MSEHLLRELAEDAPSLRAGFADEILHAARRRVRRRWTVLGAAAAAAIVAVGIPVAIGTTRGGPAPAPAVRGSSGLADRTGSAVRPSPAPERTAAAYPAGVYAAAVRYAADHPDPTVRLQRVVVVDAVCSGAADASLTGCAGPLPAGTRTAVVAAVPIASFVAAPPRVDPSAPIDTTRVYLLLGPVDRDGPRATVWVEQICGFDCVRGDQLVLALRDGAWSVTGGRGMYIS